MEIFITDEALTWLRNMDYSDVDDNTIDAYEFYDWLEDNNISYTGNLVDGIVVTVNASEQYTFIPNNELGE